MLARLLVLAIVGSSLMAFASRAEASHPFQGSGQLDINYMYSDFETGGDKRITYRLCDNLGYGVPAQWGQGVEAWDSALGSNFEFDAITSCSTQTDRAALLRWETGSECAGGWAYWRTYAYPQYYTSHGSHKDILLGLILFNRTAWLNRPTDEWRVEVAAHEWGHNMSLADHVTTSCADQSLMINYNDGGPIPTDPCVPLPAGNDVTTVWCAVYRTCSWHGFSSWGWPADLLPGGMANDYTRSDHTHMVRQSNCDFYEKYWPGSGTWTTWQNKSGPPNDQCFNGGVAISISDGQKHMVGSTYGDLWYSSNSGSTWTFLGRPAPGEPIDGPIAIANSGGKVHIVGVSKAPGSATGDVWLNIFDGSSWQWNYLGGADTIGGSVAVADRGGLVHVVGFTPASSEVWLKYYNGVSWQGWEGLGCCLAGALAIDNANAVRGNLVMTPHVGVHILATGNSNVYMRCWDTTAYCDYYAWVLQGSGGYVGPLALTNTYGEVHFASRYGSTELKHRERNP